MVINRSFFFPLIIILFLSIAALSCEMDWTIKEFRIESSSILLQGQIEGKVEKISFNRDYSRITLDSGDEIIIAPPVSDWPKEYQIKGGEVVTFQEERTIGNRSAALTVGEKGGRLIIGLGKIRSRINVPEVGEYRIKPMVNQENSGRGKVTLALFDQEGESIKVSPGERINLSDWVLYLIKADWDDPEFYRNSGISQESAPLNYDYILYRN